MNQKYDDAVVKCFLEHQLQLFPEEVAQTPEEAREFLEEVFAQVASSKKEVIRFFEDEGIDFDAKTILDEAEVFDVGDGRFLIVEG
ncbi:MAG: glyoxalase [Lachnospiraceae bacterium]|nr:glyoxalase [Lachnospiraceae bacterium]